MHNLKFHMTNNILINKNKHLELYNDKAYFSIWRGFYKIFF